MYKQAHLPAADESTNHPEVWKRTMLPSSFLKHEVLCKQAPLPAAGHLVTIGPLCMLKMSSSLSSKIF